MYFSYWLLPRLSLSGLPDDCDLVRPTYLDVDWDVCMASPANTPRQWAGLGVPKGKEGSDVEVACTSGHRGALDLTRAGQPKGRDTARPDKEKMDQGGCFSCFWLVSYFHGTARLGGTQPS